MAYEELKAQIREYIKPNDQEEITGAIMQAILLEMVNQLGSEGIYLPLTGGNVTGGIVVSSELSSPSHEALRLNQSGISVEKIASVGLNEILNVTANSITYSSYYPSQTPNTLTISLGYTGVTLSGGVTAASFINSSVDASIRYQYLLKADGNVISISDIGGTDMQTVWEALAASTNEQINVSHLSTALNGYIHPTLSNLSNGDVLVYDSVGTWVNTSMSSFLSGYATETWVNTQLASYATQSWVSTNYLNRVSTNSGDIYINDGGSSWVTANLNSVISGFGYITSSGSCNYANSAGSVAWSNVSGRPTNVSSFTNDSGYITRSALNGAIYQGNVIDTHGEGSGTITLDGTNELYAFYERGGTCDAYEVDESANLTDENLTRTSTTVQPLSANVFNGIVGYNQRYDYSGNKLAVYDLRLPTSYHWGAFFFWSFGTYAWKPAKMRVLISTSSGSYVSRYSSDSCPAYGKINVSNDSAGIRRIRLVVSSYSRLACIGLTNYSTTGLRTTYMNRCLDDAVYRNINPAKDNTWVLGTSSVRWKEIRAVDFYGTFNGVATSASSVAWSNVSGRPTALSSFTNDSGYITSSGSCNYATSAGSANILGHSVTLNSAHSLSNGDILVYDSAGTWTNVSSGLSDIRKKDVLNYNAEPTFEAVANAPAIRFTYKDARYSFNQGVKVGSIAQYWKTELPEAVNEDNEGYLSMQYEVLGLLAAIAVAKRVTNHERRIESLERENEELKKEIQALRSA